MIPSLISKVLQSFLFYSYRSQRIHLLMSLLIVHSLFSLPSSVLFMLLAFLSISLSLSPFYSGPTDCPTCKKLSLAHISFGIILHHCLRQSSSCLYSWDWLGFIPGSCSPPKHGFVSLSHLVACVCSHTLELICLPSPEKKLTLLS